MTKSETIPELKEARFAAIFAALERDAPDFKALAPNRQRAALRRAESDEAVVAIEEAIAALRPQVDHTVTGAS